MDKIKVGGIMRSDDQTLVRVLAVPPEPEASAAVLGALGRAGINLELIVQSVDREQRANYALVVSHKDMEHALGVLEEIKPRVAAGSITYTPGVSIISVFGPHLREKPIIPGAMLGALAAAGITCLAIATSISSVSCVVENGVLDTALDALTKVLDAPFQVKKRPKNY